MPLDTSTYSLALLRLDGRRWNELRQIQAQISTQAAADGSSYLEMGNTKVLVSVSGPSEGGRAQQQQYQQQQTGPGGQRVPGARIDVDINIAAFSGVDRRKRKADKRTSEMAHCIRSAFSNVVLLHVYPHSVITLSVHVLSQDGSLLAACLNACTLALIDAGIPMFGYLAACTVAGSASGSAADNESADDPLLDLNAMEELELPFLTVAILGEHNEVAVCVLENRVRAERLEGMLAQGVEGCIRVRKLLDETVRFSGDALKKKA